MLRESDHAVSTDTATLGGQALGYLRAGGREVSYGDGQTVLHRGEAGAAFYVVLGGAVEVLLESDGDKPLPLARLDSGASFGEMSLLTDEPVSADVTARGAVTLLECPAEHFRRALAECGPFRNYILGQLCNNLRRTSSQAWGFFQQAKALRTLMQSEGPTGELVAESAAMKRVETQLAELAGRSEPILITGQPGTGKLFVAAKIHERSLGGDAPLVIMDCATVERGQAGPLLFGSYQRRFDQAADGAQPIHVLGALDLANGGSLVLRHVGSLDVEAQEVLASYLAAQAGSTSGVSPNVRVMATTCADPKALDHTDGFNPALLELLTRRTLELPPMAKRRRDILPLAEIFLALRDRRVNGRRHRFDQSAEHALLSGRYAHRNAEELREAVELSALFAEEGVISSQHVFTGPRIGGTGAEWDLSTARPVRWLLGRWALPTLQAATLAFFLVVAAACLIDAAGPFGTTANSLVWGVWWPVLVLAFLLIGRAWCMVCPLSLAGRIVRRIGRLGLKPPDAMKRYATWLSVGLFLVIIWVEHVFGMTSRPAATGIFLLALMGAAASCCVLFERETWCRYLCPLGALGAGYSVGSMAHVRANPNVCATQCTTHECFKGSETVAGCPVFHHPMYAADGHVCKLCLNCVRSCPHGSAKPYLRAPLQGIWRLEGLSDIHTPFVLVVSVLFLAMLMSLQPSRWLAAPGPYTVLVAAAAAMGVAIWALLRHPMAGEQESDPAAAAPLAFAVFVLGAGSLLAFHLENMPILADIRMRAPAGTFAADRLGVTNVSLLMVLQLGAIALSGLLAAITLWRIHVHLARDSITLSPWRWRIILSLCVVYLVAALGLTLLGGIH